MVQGSIGRAEPGRQGWRLPARVVAGVLLLAACHATERAPTLFEQLPAAETGIDFVNAVPDTGSFNIVSYLYHYNGGGVTVGDVNGDGLPDLYFSSNTGPNRLYLNRGNYKFEDVTDRAGVAGPPGWKTGVTMADVNGDGRLDIYVSAVDYLTMHGHNVLYINNGDGTFTDRTHEMGLDYAGYATQAVFFDYDGDGDLDLYLQSHSTDTERAIGVAARRDVRNARTGGRLYRNDGGHFTDVSAQAGIYASAEGFGLGVVASDLDGDGCPDLYVANDFQENDYLYHNNCNGTFTESIASAMGHTSRFSMGVDAADINNDGRPDLFVADMMPEREDILKTSASSESYNLFNLRLRAGYHPQYARNTLQLNRGGGKFSEIGYLAGVYATDWSWAPLFADLDNDGRKDLFVTSGIYRRPNDLDYINYVGNDAVQASLAAGGSKIDLEVLKRMPQVPVSNHAFRNNGNLTFTDMTPAWGLNQPGYSNGAVYVDLNNSGALDLVVNNLNAPAAVYRNRSREVNGNAYLRVQLKGAGANTEGIGAKVLVEQRGLTQLLEEMPTRGFLSSVDPRLHFGLGRDTIVDSLTVIWPDRRFQVLTHVVANRGITLWQDSASGKWEYDRAARFSAATPPLFADETDRVTIPYRHVENAANDFDREPLMPHLLSTEGPALAVGDVNGDGLDDIYAGGAKWQRGQILLQQRDGSFRDSDQPAIAADSVAEDVDAIFVDVNGDGYKDLVVVSGGNEFWGEAEQLRPRLYLNDGAGHFRREKEALANVFENGSCVVAGDFDGDGHVDLFIGGRVVANKYGVSPKSHLLHNDGHGHFTDVTSAIAPALSEAGMVTSAAWVDYDGDGKLDLVIVGEW
ncbi:MAG: ASPIC/UnbV domain protein, partial [Gemmatimonadetes bacterium]|nr:ASPIC/UnbV domain protein [Gemmatimonadota bacterium]